MSKLPENYASIQLGEIASASKERGDPTKSPDSPYVGLEHIEKDTAKLVGNGIASDVTRTKSVFREGDLLYGKLRPYLNKVWIAEFDGLCSTDILVFPKSKALDNKFLKYRFLTRDFVNYANANSSGVNLPRVNSKALGRFKINLPALPEQRRIVARIEELFSRLDAGVAALRHAKAQLQRYRQSVLAAAVTGQLTQAWREQHPDTEPAEELRERIYSQRKEHWTGKYKLPLKSASKAGDLPPTWTRVTVDQLLVEPMCNGLSVRGTEEPPGVPALKLNAMAGEIIDYSPRMYLQIATPKVERIWIQEGDFFVCRGNGSVKLVGRGCTAGKPPDKVIFPDTMIRLRFAPEIRDSKWCSTIWNAGSLRCEIERRAKTTSGLHKISQSDIATIEVPLPPLAEQHQIVAEVEARTTSIDHLEAELDRQITRSKRLRQSVLAEAFRGGFS